MMIVIANQKGGVGKSTLAVHLAVWLHDRGYRVALVDADQQRSSSQWVTEAEPKITLRTVRTPDNCLEVVQNLSKHHDYIIGDGPGGIDDLSRAMLLLADRAWFAITPSILDFRSVHQATTVLRYAQAINGGRPEGTIVLNRMRTRDTISRELGLAARELGVAVANTVIRDLQAYRDAAQQGTTVSRLGKRAIPAAAEIDLLFQGLVPQASQVAKAADRKKTREEVLHD
jgi:chromosome partitioning protein